jgi:hypothetical protein
MKRILTTILAFIYLSTSIGASVHLHYCMGKLISWGLINHDGKQCATCGMPKNCIGQQWVTVIGDCCKDEHKPITVDKDQKPTEATYKCFDLLVDMAAVHFANPADGYVAAYLVGYPTLNGPPIHLKVPVFLLYRNFRI